MTTVLERPNTTTDAPVVDKRVVRRRLGPGRRIPFSLLIGPILLVGLWWLLSATGRLDPRTLSEPWVVVDTARDLRRDLRRFLLTHGLVLFALGLEHELREARAIVHSGLGELRVQHDALAESVNAESGLDEGIPGFHLAD